MPPVFGRGAFQLSVCGIVRHYISAVQGETAAAFRLPRRGYTHVGRGVLSGTAVEAPRARTLRRFLREKIRKTG